MAGRAGRWRRRPFCAFVRLMAGRATAGEPAVLGVALCHVAAGAARRGRDRAGVGLVTIGAFGVPAGRAVGLFLMTALASRALCAAVRLVATRALRVARFDLALLLRVATTAAREQ